MLQLNETFAPFLFFFFFPVGCQNKYLRWIMPRANCDGIWINKCYLQGICAHYKEIWRGKLIFMSLGYIYKYISFYHSHTIDFLSYIWQYIYCLGFYGINFDILLQIEPLFLSHLTVVFTIQWCQYSRWKDTNSDSFDCTSKSVWIIDWWVFFFSFNTLSNYNPNQISNWINFRERKDEYCFFGDYCSKGSF